MNLIGPFSTIRSRICLALMMLGLFLSSGEAHAIPRYTPQYGQSCTLCHTNPTGGGLRTEYASQFLVPEEIAAQGWSESEVSPLISPNILLGADLRTLVYQKEEGTGSTLAMQGDIYLDLTLSPHYSATIEQTLDGAGEVYGTIRGGPLDGYLKAGRRAPDFGWKFADHQMFNRRYLLEPGGTNNPGALLGSGLEVGISPGKITLTAAALGRGQEHGEDYAARLLVQESLGPVNLGLGGSVLRRQFLTDRRRATGTFWYLGWGRVTWLGEWDETRQEGRLGKLITQEVVTTLRRGLDLRLTYNYQDPDRALKNGTREKFGAGLACMPRPYFSLLAMANYWKTDPGPLIAEDSHHEGQVVIHFFY
jgi:hypothetical protein